MQLGSGAVRIYVFAHAWVFVSDPIVPDVECRGRFEAHVWYEGKQLYLGGFETEEAAALAYDLAAIRFRGREATTNFPLGHYAAELEHLESISKDELVQSLRRQSKGFSRGTSAYRGVTKHKKVKHAEFLVRQRSFSCLKR